MGLTRATVLRLAISRGLDALEAENSSADRRSGEHKAKGGR